jgi:hypothetical protein
MHNDSNDSTFTLWKDWGNAMLNFQRQPAGVNPASSVGFKDPERWTTYPMLPLPKCLYFQANPQRVKMAMTGFLPCSILAEKAKLLKTKEL